MARNQFAWERSFDRPNPLLFLVVFFGSTRTAHLVHMFHVSLHAAHAELSILSSKFLSICNPPRVVSITSKCSYSYKVIKFNTMSKFFTPVWTNHSKFRYSTFSLLKSLPYLQPTFSVRSAWVETSQTIKISFQAIPRVRNWHLSLISLTFLSLLLSTLTI